MAGAHILFSMAISHYCVSADRMLAFKRVSVRTQDVPYHDKQELIAATGQDYVPALVWDGSTVQWFDIPEFLERKVPRPTFYPDGQQAVATTLENWGHNVLEERVWRYVVTKVPPILHDNHERWVFEEMQTRARGPWHILESRREEFREDMMKHLGMVEAMLDTRDWILGEPSLADFGIYGSMSPLLTVGEPIPKELPRIRKWAKRIQGLGRSRSLST
jgi:glutathione S-transferase